MSTLIAPAPLAQTEWDEKWEHGAGEPWHLNYKNYTRADVTAAQTKLQLIDADNEGPQEDEWVGSYSLKPHFGVSLDLLRWSPQSGFVKVYVYTCLSELRSLQSGRVTVSPTTVQTLPEYHGESGTRTTQVKQIYSMQTYVKVKWGDRHYLVEEDRLEEFCDRIAGVELFKEGVIEPGFWLKAGDSEKPADGTLVLPPGYEHFRKKPITAKIVAVGESYVERDGEQDCLTRTVTPVTINAGSKHGVKAGIAFSVSAPAEGEYGYVKVLKVMERSSRALFIPQGFEMCDETGEADQSEEPAQADDVVAVAVGWKLITRRREQ